MVKIFTKEEQYNIARAVEEAESKTSAEIAILIAPASDAYQDYRFLAGFFFGTVMILILWFLLPRQNLTYHFTLLLCIQTAIVALFAWLPGFEKIFAFIIPKKERAHCTYQRAAAEYFTLSHHVKSRTPIVFIYLSVAERAVHVISGRIIRESLPSDIWKQIIDNLTASIHADGLANACVKSVHQIADLLAPHFPDKGEHNALPNEVRQLRN